MGGTVDEREISELMRRLSPQIGELGQHAVNADTSILSTSKWYFDLVHGVLARQKMLRRLWPVRVLEIASYRHIVGYMLADAIGADVTLFDLSGADLEAGLDVALEAGYRDRVERVSGDFHSLPFSDGYFDVVYISASIHHTRTPEKIIEEAMRVLAPRGIFYSQREPIASLFCFYAFVANRPHDYRPFEKHLFDRDIMRIISSPFPGARNALVFGRVENDRIPLDFYLDIYSRFGKVVEEIVYHEGLLTRFDKSLLAHADESVDALQRLIEKELLQEMDLAIPLLGETERLLGFRLPTADEISEMAGKVAAALKARPQRDNQVEWARAMGRIFGASIRMVVRRKGRLAWRGRRKFRVRMQSGGRVLSDPDHWSRLGLNLSVKLLPDLQNATADELHEKVFPIEDWVYRTRAGRAPAMWSRRNGVRLNIGSGTGYRMVVCRYRLQGQKEGLHRVRFCADGRLLVEDLPAQPEDRFVKFICRVRDTEVGVTICDGSGQLMDQPGGLVVTVLQAVPVSV